VPVDLSSFILDVPDYPQPGVAFQNIAPLLGAEVTGVLVAEPAFFNLRNRLAAHGLTDVGALVTTEAG
jgi:hypothetical protein